MTRKQKLIAKVFTAVCAALVVGFGFSNLPTDKASVSAWSDQPVWGEFRNITPDSDIPAPSAEALRKRSEEFISFNKKYQDNAVRQPFILYSDRYQVELSLNEQGAEAVVRANKTYKVFTRAALNTLAGSPVRMGSSQLSPDGAYLAIEVRGTQSRFGDVVRTLVLKLPSLERVLSAYGDFAMRNPWSGDSNGLYLRVCNGSGFLFVPAYCHFGYLPLDSAFRRHLIIESGDADVFEEPVSGLVFMHRKQQIASQGQLLLLGRRTVSDTELLGAPSICSSAIQRLTVAQGAIWAITLDESGTPKLIRFENFGQKHMDCPTRDANSLSLEHIRARVSLGSATTDSVLLVANSPWTGALYLAHAHGKIETLLTAPRTIVTRPSPTRESSLLPAKVTLIPDIGDASTIEVSLPSSTQPIEWVAVARQGDPTLSVTAAKSEDGVAVPLSIFRTEAINQPKAYVMEVYAAYNNVADRRLSATIEFWLSVGYGYAICHARGGGDLGDAWHIAGRGRNKLNSTRDTIACAETIRNQNNNAPVIVSASSAGGIPAAGAAVLRPDLFAATVLENPFINLAANYDARHLRGADGEEFGTRNVGSFVSGLAYDPSVIASRETKRNIAPLFLIVSENDRLVPPTQSAVFALLLIQHHTPSLVLGRVIPNSRHRLTSGQRTMVDASIYAHVDALMGKR